MAWASGEDSSYPASELDSGSSNSAGPAGARGWKSPRFASFPQEVGLVFLDGMVAISQVQILSHETCIAQRVELYVGAGESYSRADFRRLGYASLKSNERSGYTARELKSVFVEAAGNMLRLVLHDCHPNAHNLFNQVGIVAINVIGRPIAGGAAPASVPDKPELELAPSVPTADQRGAATGVDPETSEVLRLVAEAKEAAIVAEAYSAAKRLREAEVRLRAMGAQLATIHDAKQAAVAEEDYDEAKRLREDMARVRASYTSDLDVEVDVHAGRVRLRNDADVNGGGNATAAPAPAEGLSGAAELPSYAAPRRGSGGFGQRDAARLDIVEEAAPMPHAGFAGGTDEGEEMKGGDVEEAPLPTLQRPESRLLRPAGATALEEALARSDDPGAAFGADAEPEGSPRRRSLVNSYSKGGAGGDDGEAERKGAEFPDVGTPGDEGGDDEVEPTPREEAPRPEELSGVPGAADLPAPDKLSPAAASAPEVVEVCGEYVARCFFSKSWQLREAALLKVEVDLTAFEAQPPRVVALVGRLVEVSAKSERVPQVFQAATRLITPLLEHMAPKARRAEVAPALAGAAIALTERLGDSNLRSREAASHALTEMAEDRNVGCAFVAAHLLKPFRKGGRGSNRGKPPVRPVTTRLNILHLLVEANGALEKNGLAPDAVVEFMAGVDAWGHPSAEVREAAREVTLELWRSVGSANVEPLLASHLKPKVIDELRALAEA